MIDTPTFFQSLEDAGIDYFAGVPDSLLSAFGAYVADHVPDERHVIAANEGAAVALAAGRYLATNQPGLVYLQNSGQGNMVNPLLSLADPEVYAIPMLLLAGWRGEPGVPDEPQHRKQGRVTNALFEAMEIPVEELPVDTDAAVVVARQQLALAIEQKRPTGLLVRANSFSPYKLQREEGRPELMRREDAVAQIIAALPSGAVIIATTGHISRELYEYRVRHRQSHQQDFYTVGSMGHASQIALGVASAQPDRPIVCLDGDGAVLMHMGSLAIVGQAPVAANFRHIVLNNGAHGSVGGQPTVGFGIDLPMIAKSCGYRFAESVKQGEELSEAVQRCLQANAPALLEVKVGKTARKDLGRPETTPIQNKEAFMQYLRGAVAKGKTVG